MKNWEELSQQQRNAAYDNNAAVANSANLINERNAASVSFRSDHADYLDIPYLPGERTRFDLYPAAVSNAPCLVFIHGGYWQRNRREDFACFAAGMMACGWSVAMPGYTLSPDASLSDIHAEIEASLSWLSANGCKYGLAKGAIIISGWSAGAHLAALSLGHPAVKAGMAISGVYDLAPIRQTHLNDKLALTDKEVEQLSALRREPVPKPLSLAYGTRELPILVRDSRALHKARAAGHCSGALVPLAGEDHFSILKGLMVTDSELTKQIQLLSE